MRLRHPAPLALNRRLHAAAVGRIRAARLKAAKSAAAHTEAAAGLVGLVHAACAQARSRAVEVTHLRALNPYVTAALGGDSGTQVGASGAGGTQVGASDALMPQWQSGAAAEVRSRAIFGVWAGVTLIWYSGTNAHAVLRARPDGGEVREMREGAAAAMDTAMARCSWLVLRQVCWPTVI